MKQNILYALKFKETARPFHTLPLDQPLPYGTLLRKVGTGYFYLAPKGVSMARYKDTDRIEIYAHTAVYHAEDWPSLNFKQKTFELILNPFTFDFVEINDFVYRCFLS